MVLTPSFIHTYYLSISNFELNQLTIDSFCQMLKEDVLCVTLYRQKVTPCVSTRTFSCCPREGIRVQLVANVQATDVRVV